MSLSSPEINSDLLIKKYRHDLVVESSDLSINLYFQLQDFAPFGLGNPQPIFKSVNQQMLNPKKIGKQLQHLKFSITNLDAVYFNSPENVSSIDTGVNIDLIYSLDLNIWNGRSNLQLICKNIELSK